MEVHVQDSTPTVLLEPKPFLQIPARFWINDIKGAFLDKWKDKWVGTSTARQTKL